MFAINAGHAQLDLFFYLINVLNETFGTQEYDEGALKKYSAKNLTSKQCELFTKALSGKV